MKEVRAVGNYMRVAPRKARLVVGLIRGLNVNEALSILGLSRKKAANTVGKILKSAMANAVAKEKLSPEELVVSKAFVDEGPTLKRFRARAMGRATIIRKRTSHITILLKEQEGKKPSSTKAEGAKAKKDLPVGKRRKGKRTGK